MFSADKISLDLSFDWWLLALASAILILYSLYIYRYTVPVVSPVFRKFLTFIRISALLLLLFALFEPVLFVTHTEEKLSSNILFIDKSSSITIEDSTERHRAITDLVETLDDNLKGNSKIFLFDDDLKECPADSVNYINFDGNLTNYSVITDYISESEDNIASAVLISDGIITDGKNPIHDAGNLGIPFYTVGIGDSSKRKDISSGRVTYGDYIYSGKETSIGAEIIQRGYKGEKTVISLLEDGKVISGKSVILSDEITSVYFDYKPESEGEKRMEVRISTLEDEEIKDNNRKLFFLNVLGGENQVMIISGTPSPDIRILKASLGKIENLNIKTIVETGRGKYTGRENFDAVDSADIFIFHSYPSPSSGKELSDMIKNNLNKKATPFVFISGENEGFRNLSIYGDHLPLKPGRISTGFTAVQPEIKKSASALLKHPSEDYISDWEKLPPFEQSNSEFIPRSGSDLIAGIKIRNISVNNPLIITRSVGKSRSIAIHAKNIWKWKLQNEQGQSDLFDSFINASVKWLSAAPDQEQVNADTDKKVYTLTEDVAFRVSVYDETFNSIDDAAVTAEITNGDNKYNISFAPEGNGIFSGEFPAEIAGDFSYTVRAEKNNVLIGSDDGKFSVGEIEIEKIDPVMRRGFLELLANSTGGKYFSSENIGELKTELEKITNLSRKKESFDSEFRLWSEELLLIIIILLFSIEWFFRKRAGML